MHVDTTVEGCCCYCCRYYIVYMIFLVHGVGVLMPWNMFINANDVCRPTAVHIRLTQSQSSTSASSKVSCA